MATTTNRMASNVGDIVRCDTAAQATEGIAMFVEAGHIVFRMGPFDFAVYDLWNTETGEDWTPEVQGLMAIGAI